MRVEQCDDRAADYFHDAGPRSFSHSAALMSSSHIDPVASSGRASAVWGGDLPSAESEQFYIGDNYSEEFESLFGYDYNAIEELYDTGFEQQILCGLDSVLHVERDQAIALLTAEYTHEPDQIFAEPLLLVAEAHSGRIEVEEPFREYAPASTSTVLYGRCGHRGSFRVGAVCCSTALVRAASLSVVKVSAPLQQCLARR